MLRNTDPALQRSFLLALDCQKRGDLAGAEAIYSRLLALDPADGEVLYLFGCLKLGRGEREVGLECLRMAQQLSPKDARIPYSAGTVCQEDGNLEDAVLAYRQALAIDPSLRVAWENLCAACYDADDFVQGLAAAEKALAMNSESPLAIRGAANCLTALGRRAEALAVLETGVNAHPALPELRIHRAWELVANGRFADGFAELEWRNSRRGERDAPPRSVPFPRWNGEASAGKTVLVYGEQGVGDEVMYAPFVQGLVQAGANCLLECEQRLVEPFAKAFPDCRILPRSEKDQIPWQAGLPHVDYCISALSLPRFFAHPFDGRAFLAANPSRREYWQKRLAACGGTGLKVGVSWRGGADPKARKFRSLPTEILGGLLDGAQTFVSLQYGASADEVAALSPKLRHFPEVDPLVDLEDFFALVSALDAVVSVDNSTVHFSGALGVPTLLMLPVYAEWRWGDIPCGVSPWYRSVEIVRQPEASVAGWQQVVSAAAEWLRSGVKDSELIHQEEGCKTLENVWVESGACNRKAVLVGDTNFWYHWGCSCTSLGLHEGLRSCYDEIRVVPLARLHASRALVFDSDSLDSEAFFAQFRREFPDVFCLLEEGDAVVVNGEGSIHGASPIALTLLYIAYMAKHRLGKQTAIVNHSCFPGESPAVVDYYSKVYRSLDVAVVREQKSFSIASAFGGKVVQGFDSLPLFLEKSALDSSGAARKIVLGGSVAWTQDLVGCLVKLAQHVTASGYGVEIVSGAKAFLAADEIGFVEQITKALRAAGVAHELTFPASEREWLASLGSAALVVSGRFHYSIAAAFQRIPFLVAESNTAKIDGLLDALALDPRLVRLAPEFYPDVARMADRLLASPELGVVETSRLEVLKDLARANFEALP